MAKFSQKQGGKEIGNAEVYAQPHTGSSAGVELGNGYSGAKPTRADAVKMSVGNIRTWLSYSLWIIHWVHTQLQLRLIRIPAFRAHL